MLRFLSRLKDELGNQLNLPRRRIASKPRAQYAGRWRDRGNDPSELTSIGEVVDRLIEVRVIQDIEETGAEDEGLSFLKEVHLGALQKAQVAVEIAWSAELVACLLPKSGRGWGKVCGDQAGLVSQQIL